MDADVLRHSLGKSQNIDISSSKKALGASNDTLESLLEQPGLSTLRK